QPEVGGNGPEARPARVGGGVVDHEGHPVPHRLQARTLTELGLHLVGFANHVVGRRGGLDDAVLHEMDTGLVAVEAFSGIRDDSVESVLNVSLAQRHRHVCEVRTVHVCMVRAWKWYGVRPLTGMASVSTIAPMPSSSPLLSGGEPDLAGLLVRPV